jgi:hypothetical protein
LGLERRFLCGFPSVSRRGRGENILKGANSRRQWIAIVDDAAGQKSYEGAAASNAESAPAAFAGRKSSPNRYRVEALVSQET